LNVFTRCTVITTLVLYVSVVDSNPISLKPGRHYESICDRNAINKQSFRAYKMFVP